MKRRLRMWRVEYHFEGQPGERSVVVGPCTYADLPVASAKVLNRLHSPAQLRLIHVTTARPAREGE